MLERLAEAEAMTLDDYRADLRKRIDISYHVLSLLAPKQ